MRPLFAQNGVGALRLTPAKGEILAGSFVERLKSFRVAVLATRCAPNGFRFA
jgi:hypothetical protein